MKSTILKIALLASAVSAVGLASPISCNAGASNINVVGLSLACAGSGLTFDNFTVTGTNVPTVGISSITFDAATGIVLLDFNPNSNLPGDIILGYRVLGKSDSIDFTVSGRNIIFTEESCSVQFCNVQGYTQYAFITNALSNQGSANLANGGANAPFTWIVKDINYSTSTSALTHFTNSHHVPVPEPMTLSMVGAGLLALGLIGRKKK
jgi:hypothetical protein